MSYIEKKFFKEGQNETSNQIDIFKNKSTGDLMFRDPLGEEILITPQGGLAPIINNLPTGPAYKVYTALLTQSGIDAPVATVLENTIGNITWTYLSIGSYAGNLISAFPLNKTYFSVNNRFSDDNGASAYDAFLFRANDDFFALTLWNNGTPSDNLIFSGAPISIEIRVYN
jgi:hypothetical protein